MKVFLYRHANADKNQAEEDRMLTDEGRLQVIKLAQVINDREFADIVEIWHSSLVRTKECVEIFRRFNGKALHGIELHQIEELSPDADVMQLCTLLARCEGDVICCGHNPFLEKLITALCIGETGLGLIELKKGAMVRLDRVFSPSGKLPIGFWTIKWHIDPRMLSLNEQDLVF